MRAASRMCPEQPVQMPSVSHFPSPGDPEMTYYKQEQTPPTWDSE